MQRYNYFLELQYFYPKKMQKTNIFLISKTFCARTRTLVNTSKGMLTQSVPKNAIRRQS